MTWTIAKKTLTSRLLLGTALFPSPSIMQQAILRSATNVITVSIRRHHPEQQAGKAFWDYLKQLNCHILPNTAGCRKPQEAVMMAQMTRELFQTHWIKLEVIGDDYNLQPDPYGLIEATKLLIAEGFEVFPYCTDDLVLCQRLVDCGCEIIMPWASPIGSGQGLLNPYALDTLRQRLPTTKIIVDAGIGSPAQAAQAMELGADGVLTNSAIALADDPITMAEGFKHAVIAGHLGYQAGRMPVRNLANPSTPLVDTPFWLQATSSSHS